MPTALSDIEADCVPWHYLVDRKQVEISSVTGPFGHESLVQFLRFSEVSEKYRAIAPGAGRTDEVPTLDELNSEQPPDREIEGVVDSGSRDYQLKVPEDVYRDRGITRLIEIDVREFPVRSSPREGDPKQD
jgi:hypothetical protein